MSLTLTLWLSGAALALALLCGWLGARPPNPLKGPRMIPYRPIMVAATTMLVILLVHLATLLGLRQAG